MTDYDIKTVLTRNSKIKPDQAALSFGKYFTDHMFVMDYAEGYGWMEAKIVPNEPISMDPAAMVLHYGQAVFEGMKAYKGDDGKIRLFRPKANFARLNKSNERLCIPKLDEEMLLYALKELIKVDAAWIPAAPGTSLYIRPMVIATEAAVGVHPSSNYKCLIILSPVGAYYPTGLAPVGIWVEDEYVRAVRGGIGAAKAAANYAASLKGQQKAIEEGYAQVLWLDGVERKYVEEAGNMNVFFRINGELVTPELNGSVLPGITRDSVITLAKSFGIKVAERKIAIEEVVSCCKDGSMKEAFGAGTAAVICPISKFAWNGETYTVGAQTTGELSQKMYDTLTGIQYGRLEDKFNWVEEVL